MSDDDPKGLPTELSPEFLADGERFFRERREAGIPPRDLSLVITRPIGHDEHERPRDRALYAGLGCMFIGSAVIVAVAPFALGWLP